MAITHGESLSDSDLWARVRGGDAGAFEALVRRHQSLVCSVAYSCCGDLALSEDVAQETFWAAWRDRAGLAQPERLRAWLCGIARNLGHNARRRDSRAPRMAAGVGQAAEPPSPAPGPAEEAVSREEEAVVWQALEQVPETYREPLILFYREHHSVAEAAAALELSEDAVKQRLSRGRDMLREQVAYLVEGALRRSRPGKAFTLAVMAGVASLSVGAKTAFAGAGVPAGAAALKAVGAGTVLGSLGGLAGGWFGTWLPAQLAPTNRERIYVLRVGLRMLLVSLLFTTALLAVVLGLFGPVSPATYLTFWAAWMVSFVTYVTAESVILSREVARIRRETAPEADPNTAPLRAGLVAVTSRHRGRVYRSQAMLLGLPLVDVNVSDPGPQAGGAVARGWVAVGDDARGVLLAVGGKARGFVAVGGRTLGVLSFGGVAAGVVAVGGVALGVLSLGGLAVGAWALGGGAIGWEACGGGALGWRAAFGGAAVAHDYAVGGTAIAPHANDEAAKAILLNHPLVAAMQWYIGNQALATTALVLFSVGVPALMLALMYRRDR